MHITCYFHCVKCLQSMNPKTELIFNVFAEIKKDINTTQKKNSFFFSFVQNHFHLLQHFTVFQYQFSFHFQFFFIIIVFARISIHFGRRLLPIFLFSLTRCRLNLESKNHHHCCCREFGKYFRLVLLFSSCLPSFIYYFMFFFSAAISKFWLPVFLFLFHLLVLCSF